MDKAKTVLITGASGNLGSKLRQHLEDRYSLRLLDLKPGDDPAIQQADLSIWDESWANRFQSVDTVVHMAADPTAHQTWPNVVGPNIDAVFNVFTASIRAGVKRVVYASSNHAMGGYKDIEQLEKITTDLPPLPGTRYRIGGEQRDSIAYGSAKLMGERLGKCYADAYSLSVIAVRIGAIRPGSNQPSDFPPDREEWFRLMWLSNRDYCQLMERCIEADPSIRFAIVNGMSANTGMRWDLDHTRKLLGYEPLDDVRR
jgi:uronate dehydrogenase